MRQVGQLRFILYTKGTNIRFLIDRFFEAAGISPAVVVELDNVEGHQEVD